MQKQVLALFIMVLANSGCAKRTCDPCEVVGQQYRHRYGVVIEEKEWVAGGSTGQVASNLKNGVTVTKSYTGGILDGDCTYTYPHSKNIEKTATYLQGNLLEEKVHYRNGTLASQKVFTTPETTTLYTWYDNGSPKSIEHYEKEALVSGEYYDLSHHLDSQVAGSEGLKTKRNPFGQLVGVDTIKSGFTTLTVTYYPNHAIRQMIPYHNQQIHGELKTFLPGGEPASIETWSGGEQTGVTTLFENGEKIAEIPYVRGIKNGIEKRYGDGQLAEEISWKADVRHGPSLTTVADVTKVDYFFQGKNVSRSVYEKLTHSAGTTAIN